MPSPRRAPRASRSASVRAPPHGSGRSPRRRSLAGVTRDDPADRAGRLEEVLPLERAALEAADELRYAVDGESPPLVERDAVEGGEIGGAGRPDLVHEAIDGDLVAAVLERGERP